MIQPKPSVQGLPVYQPGKPLEEVQRELGLTDVIKLASNENPFGCSPKISAALQEISDYYHQYPEATAPLLNEKLAKHLNIDPDQIIFGNGSDEIIQMICRTFLEPEDEAIMADITFPVYKTEVRIEGGVPVTVPLKDGTHDLKAMKEAITDKTKIVWICNPNNPTGTFVDHNTLQSFLQEIPKHVVVVLDEAYVEYVTDPTFPNSLALLAEYPQLIILRTFSKIYGLAAFRIGYGIAHPEIIGELHRVRPPFNTSRLAQQAALTALDDQDFVAHCKEVNAKERERLIQQIEQWDLHYFPTQGNFILFDTGAPSEEAYQYLLERGVIVRAGLAYPTYIRVTVGTPEQNHRFIRVFSEFLQQKQAD